MRVLTAFLLLLSAANAQPALELDGPSKARQGQLIILTVPSSVDQVAWDVTPDVDVPKTLSPEAVAESVRRLQAANFDVPDVPANREVLWAISCDGHSLYLASYPGEVHVSVATLTGSELAVKNHCVVITGADTEDEDDPDDPDDPVEPDEPDPPPLSGLAKDAREQALLVDRKAGEAEELGEVFRLVARKAVDEGWTPEKLWGGELRAAVASVISSPGERSRWQSFSTWMNAAFPVEVRGDMPEVVRRLNQLADGLEAAEGQ